MRYWKKLRCVIKFIVYLIPLVILLFYSLGSALGKTSYSLTEVLSNSSSSINVDLIYSIFTSIFNYDNIQD